MSSEQLVGRGHFVVSTTRQYNVSRAGLDFKIDGNGLREYGTERRIIGDAVDFLKCILPNGPWTLTAIIPDGQTETQTFDPATEGEARAFISQHNGARNLYYSANEPKRALSKKAAKDDIKTIHFLHLDADPRTDEKPDQAKARIRASLQKDERSPTAIVDSGNGIQALWALSPPIELPTDAPARQQIIEDIEARNVGLIDAFGATRGTQNVDRILRLPETTNIPNKKKLKDGRTVCQSALVAANGAAYPLETFPAAKEQPINKQARQPGGVGLSTDPADNIVLSPSTLSLLHIVGSGAFPSRSELLFAFLTAAIRAGADDGTIIDHVLNATGGGIHDHVQDNGGEKYLERQIERALKKLSDEPEIEAPMEDASSTEEGQSQAPTIDAANTYTATITAFNKRYAVINENGKVLIYEHVVDPSFRRKVLVRIKFEDLRKMYQNQNLTVRIGEKVITKTKAEWWLNAPKRRQYLGGVVFVASGNAPDDCWNLWSGFAVKPAPGDWGFMKAHILNILCARNTDNYEYLMNSVARMFQFPDQQGEVAVVMRGKKGSGKGTLGNMLHRAWGQHSFHITNAKHLIGQYNAHLRDCVFIFADEAFFAGDRQHEGILKGLITEETITIEYKFGAVVNVPNLTHILMASNSDWVVPASQGERRYFVLDVLPDRIGNRAYFNAIYHQMLKRGGLAAMIHELLHRDISQFGFRTVPSTVGLHNQQTLSLPSVDQWWLTVLDRGFVWKSRHGAPLVNRWKQFCTMELLYRSYLQWCDETRERHRQSREQVGRHLSDFYPRGQPRTKHPIYEVENVPHDAAHCDEHVAVWQSRPHGYQLGTLDAARQSFAEKLGLFKNRWPERDKVTGIDRTDM
jgi:hypothetical protein